MQKASSGHSRAGAVTSGRVRVGVWGAPDIPRAEASCGRLRSAATTRRTRLEDLQGKSLPRPRREEASAWVWKPGCLMQTSPTEADRAGCRLPAELHNTGLGKGGFGFLKKRETRSQGTPPSETSLHTFSISAQQEARDSSRLPRLPAATSGRRCVPGQSGSRRAP